MDDIPYVTDEELKECKMLCLTGGEPFAFANPGRIAQYYKDRYPNIKKVIVYTNAVKMRDRLKHDKSAADGIDGFNISLKTAADISAFEDMYANRPDYQVPFAGNDRVYDFTGEFAMPESSEISVFTREWQEEFVPANDSIFRKA